MTKKNTKNYISPEDFFYETLNCIKRGEISNELAVMFTQLCEKYANHPKFVRYFHIREDLIATGLVACVKAYDKFRPQRNILTRDGEGEIIDSESVEWDGVIPVYDHNLHYSPFSFFTSVVHNAIIQQLKKEYNHRNIINAIRLENELPCDYGYEDYMKEKEEKDRQEEVDGGELVAEVDDEEEEVVVKPVGGIVW